MICWKPNTTRVMLLDKLMYCHHDTFTGPETASTFLLTCYKVLFFSHAFCRFLQKENLKVLPRTKIISKNRATLLQPHIRTSEPLFTLLLIPWNPFPLLSQSLDFLPGPVISTVLYEANKSCPQSYSASFIEFGTLVWTFEIIHTNSLILQNKSGMTCPEFIWLIN